MNAPVVLHIPHASAEIPHRERRSMVGSDPELALELLRMTDWFTDDVFGGMVEGADVVSFPVSRLVLDPERFEDDADEAMSSLGMGVLYTTTSHGEPLRDSPSEAERERLLNLYYHPHHRRLGDAVARQLARHGCSAVIDCHSFPSRPLPYEVDQALPRPEICIGTDEFHTPSWLADAAVGAFEDGGFEVEVNRPFAGALVPGRFWRKTTSVSAFMIEIRRDLYMDEATGRPLAALPALADRVRGCGSRVVDAFMEGPRRRPADPSK